MSVDQLFLAVTHPAVETWMLGFRRERVQEEDRLKAEGGIRACTQENPPTAPQEHQHMHTIQYGAVWAESRPELTDKSC